MKRPRSFCVRQGITAPAMDYGTNVHLEGSVIQVGKAMRPATENANLVTFAKQEVSPRFNLHAAMQLYFVLKHRVFQLLLTWDITQHLRSIQSLPTTPGPTQHMIFNANAKWDITVTMA